MEERVNPLQLLMDEFESEQTQVRVNAIRRLPIIAAVLGESSQAKGQILGFLDNVLNSDENDEVLYGMAESLLNLSRYFKLKMIFIIEKLVCVEETVVRDKAVECYIALVKYLKKSEIREVLIPNVKKLAESNNFTTKISAIHIMTEIYPACSEDDKKIIRNKLNTLFSEDSLMVRRVLASKMGTLCNYMSKSTVLSELIKSFKTLTNDDSANVRILTIESLVDLAKNLNDEENKTHMIPIIITLTSDKSWRVKYSLAKNFSNISKAVGREVTDSLVPIFSSLLRDPEGEVRISAVKALSQFIHMLKPERVNSILAYLQTLAKDNVNLVRVSVATVLQNILQMKLGGININVKDSIGGRIHSVLKELVFDEDLEVKIEGMKILGKWGSFVKFDDLKDIINETQGFLGKVPNWRLRNAIINSLLDLSCIYGDMSLFSKHFKDIFVFGIRDNAYSVRQNTITYIKKLSKFLNDNYLITYLGVEMLQVIDDPSKFSYQKRISSIYGMGILHKTMKEEGPVNQLILNQVLPLLDDSLRNIRYVAVKVLKEVASLTKKKEMKEAIRKKFKELIINEHDKEICFIAHLD
jgi:serine/threonine-protein phosphatase 2A regulatory subunit A